MLGMGRYERRLVVAARRLVAAGWPIIPGAWWAPWEGRHRCDLAGCVTRSVHPAPIGCHDAMVCAAGWTDLTRYALANAEQVTQRWAHRPYTVLVVTGVVADIIDSPTAIGAVLLGRLRMTGRPVMAAHGAGRLLVFVAAGRLVDPDRAGEWARAGVVFHQRRSWVALPPSVVDGRPTRWAHRLPRTGRIALPDVDLLLPVLDQLKPPAPPPARGVVSMPDPARRSDRRRRR